jgi:BlaI family penicillinase repressor
MLSPHELEIMELLWSKKQALSRTEIIDLSINKSWKPSTIHLLLNSLLKKELVIVDGFKQTGKNYGRTFRAALTREEYTAKELSQRLPKSGDSQQVDLAGVFAALVSNTQLSEDQLDELQLILDDKKKELQR